MSDKFYNPKGRYLNSLASRLKDYNNQALKAPDTLVEETHGTYAALLFDQRWIQRRKEILERDEYKCVICLNEEKLQVHHRQYHMIKISGKFKPPWDYEDYLLITLCESCHKRGHSKYKVPVIQI
ncbi:HNH endonuclease [Flectobacillus major]|uniref:HNH endonuclease n=1 Tax=Flectobacillus major TaxID=103 RepID=UPI00047A0D4F|nr:hypothetical protein [Flectobacillus major]